MNELPPVGLLFLEAMQHEVQYVRVNSRVDWMATSPQSTTQELRRVLSRGLPIRDYSLLASIAPGRGTLANQMRCPGGHAHLAKKHT